MFKHLLAAAVATALIAAPLAPAFAQAATEKEPKRPRRPKKTAKAAKKKLTAQQQKMKDCAAEVGGLQEGKERQGPRRVPQVHEHVPEGLSAQPNAPPNAPRASTRL